MKDIVTPVPQEEVKTVIRKCLEQAALVNYSRLSEYAKIEGKAPFSFQVFFFFNFVYLPGEVSLFWWAPENSDLSKYVNLKLESTWNVKASLAMAK